MKVLKFPTIAITICFMLGIIVGNHYKPDPDPLFLLLTVQLLLLFTTLVLVKKFQKAKLLFGLFLYTLSFISGIFVFVSHYQLNHKNHYSNWILSGEKVILTGVISEELKANPYSHKYYLEVTQINNQELTGKVLVNFSKKNKENLPEVGTVILAKCAIKALIKPNNPNQFDYADYLEKRNVFHQIYLENKNFRYLKTDKNTNYFLQKTRESISKDIAKNNIPTERLHIIQALLLGQRQDINSELLQKYSKAGAIHILAISGLHIGILLFFFKSVLSPLRRIKHGAVVQLLILISLLWLFAILSGLSPSVVRAVTMFSFVGIGIYLQRATNIFNTIAVSILLLLLFKPNFLFEVGFQLSYSAVIAIVWIQPLFTKFWRPKNKILNYFYEIITVSIAAQVGVLPLSIYYFHQFPGLFFMTNLIIIPLLTVILVIGILVVITNAIGVSFLPLSYILSESIGFMNYYVNWIASFEKFIFSDISFNRLLLITLYALLIGIIILLKKPNYLKLQFVLILIFSYQLAYFGSIYSNYKTDEAVLFHYPKKTIITLKENNKITIYTNDTLIENNYVVKNYLQGNFGEIDAIEKVPNAIKLFDKKLLIIDENAIYKVPEKVELILLTQSPKINLERLIDYHQPKLIIANGSNYLSTIEQWKKTCLKKNIPFHITNEKGYLKIY
ncbi:ComEC/Rec2 family competence protein [Flavobacterium sp. UBA6135]|uniref:ComEC/Rec2 family competence protein n=1 Tax=Flavobacterium sp. UBA6135 TaxID=1946553 RepID=UPI0025BE21C8|nr:ComEC/Rec2 family competence protein [Flavobacterium sp. UBA6135]